MTVTTFGNINFIHGDCMDYMRALPDKAFSLAIVDPNYGIGASSVNFRNGNKKHDASYFRNECWDTDRPPKEYFVELQRVSENQIIWGGNYFSDLLPSFRCFVVWDKTIHGRTYADCELAWTSFDRVARYYRENIVQTNIEGRIHPTQKSIKLYSWLLSNFSESSNTILDTHLGSGSSAIAAYRLGFTFTGIELDKDYYDASIERFKKELLQTSWLIPSIEEEDRPVQKGMF